MYVTSNYGIPNYQMSFQASPKWRSAEMVAREAKKGLRSLGKNIASSETSVEYYSKFGNRSKVMKESINKLNVNKLKKTNVEVKYAPEIDALYFFEG